MTARPIDVIDFIAAVSDQTENLEHSGVKGMKWGVRKDRSQQKSSTSDADSASNSRNWKKAAIIFGGAVGVAAITAGAIYVAKNSDVSMSDIKKLSDAASPKMETAEKFTEAMAKEPVGIVHAARGKHKGWTFPMKGGLSDPLKEYERSGLDDYAEAGFFNRYGDRQEKLAAVFKDPEGRKDRSGRDITHQVMLPESLASAVKVFDDVQPLVWPMIKDTYQVLYDLPAYG